MRVLHVYSGNLYGGVEMLSATLARYRAACPEMEPHFALCFEGRLSNELREMGVPVHMLGRVRLSYPHTVARARMRLRNSLRSGNFGAVICHAPWSLIIAGPVVRSTRLPLIFWMHGATSGRHWIERWARRTTPDLVLCNSRFTATTAGNLFLHVPSEVIYPPVPSDEIVLAPLERARLRSELGAADSEVVIIQTSRMEPWKGHALHLHGLALLRDVPGWTCWVVGGAQRQEESGYLKSLEERAEKLGIRNRVRFLGQRQDVRELLAAADIHCQPNTGPEPFGIAFVEALAAGLPVVTTSLGGAREIVDESCGVLVPPGDAWALAAALQELIKSPTLRANLSGQGPRRAEKLCGVEQRTRELYSLLLGVVERRRTNECVSLA